MKSISSNIPPNGGTSQVGKRYTVKELAVQFGCTEETIRKHSRKLFPELMGAGVKKYFTEAQVTVLLKSIQVANESKKTTHSSHNSCVVGAETELTPILEIQLLEEESLRLEKKKKELYKRLLEEERLAHKATQKVLAETQEELKKEEHAHSGTRSGLNHYQTIAEAGGLVKSDKDDIEDTYPKWAEYWNNKRKWHK